MSTEMTPDQAVTLIEESLRECDIPCERQKPDGSGATKFTVRLPGENKFSTSAMISVHEKSVQFETFVCRNPEENFLGVYRYLLKRNRKFYILTYTIDDHGDIYLVGKISLNAFNEQEFDTILGQMAQTIDEDFNILIELGFASSIRKEWKWRKKNGQSTHNLRAFKHLIEEEPEQDSTPQSTTEPTSESNQTHQ